MKDTSHTRKRSQSRVRFFETQPSSAQTAPSVPRLIAAGALTLLTGAIIAGCAATAPTPRTAAEAATVAPAAPAAPTATAAAPQGVPPGPPPGGAGGPPKVITPTLTNIAYATASGTQVLDLYLPEGNGPFPVVVNIHPGGFFSGDKDMVPGTPGKALLKAGYAIASINYRLSGEATFPAAVQDAKAAVRFLRANAAKYKLNPDKIAAFGQSAGGNLASMLGTAGDVAEFDDPSLGNAGVSSRVQAVINWFGPNDFSRDGCAGQGAGLRRKRSDAQRGRLTRVQVSRRRCAKLTGTGEEGQPNDLHHQG